MPPFVFFLSIWPLRLHADMRSDCPLNSQDTYQGFSHELESGRLNTNVFQDGNQDFGCRRIVVDGSEAFLRITPVRVKLWALWVFWRYKVDYWKRIHSLNLEACHQAVGALSRNHPLPRPQ